MKNCQKTKILFFIESLQCGGAEKSLVSLLQMLDYDIVDVDLMMIDPTGVFRKYVPDQVNVIGLPSANPLLSRTCNMLYSVKWRLNRALGIKRHNAEVRWPMVRHAMPCLDKEYDIAIAYQQGIPTYYISEKINAAKRIAWVNIDLQGAGYRESFNRKYYDRYDTVVSVSRQLYDTLAKSSYLDTSKLVTVYDILNATLIRKMAQQRCDIFDKCDDKLKIVTVGRLSRQKNYPLAVETARLLRDKGVDFIWCFVGEGLERRNIEALIDKYSLSDNVLLAGLQENPYPYMLNADLYVHTASFEGYGLTIAEAKILGKPVVSTNFNIVSDQITDGVNGLIADMRAESVASKILNVYNDNILRKAIIDAVSKEANTTSETEVRKFYKIIGLI